MIRRRAATPSVTVLVALTALAVLAVLVAGTGQARAAGYRYWSFWDRDGDRWVYASQGPSTARPLDGDVQGFRFAVSEDSDDATRPRGTADFTAVCADVPARDGRKRVALVIDFGTAADAPSGEAPPEPRTACAVVSPDATAAEALASVATPLRYSADALLCAIAGYPRTGCGEQVAAGGDPNATAEKEKEKGTEAKEERKAEDAGPSVGPLVGVAAVVVLGAAALWQARRRRDAP
ncbi:SCO2322 family protein [Streptomyces sp. ALI-76-A]|uniref:SCO2322 family protein n=1 Tax=Streptomyces sp. ALI-76-A TaxID=3025736 RepID=UPI00256F4958|nr:SCO2322 family protein [Streptomyces sp. ALI-76-A]MDL5201312.1 SCO2322 family protein [Streptomyces sp. ALI-76-A]